MVSSRKRGRQQMEAPSSPAPQAPQKEQGLLHQLRNMWQFANVAQYIFTFGKAVKIDDDFDIEDLEFACLEPGTPKLKEIGLAMLKFVSSHRGLTLDIFDEYTRRQYVAKAPQRNPFGEGDEPAKFNDFDIFTKLKVLHQLSVWTFNNADRIRERMEEHKDSEQTYWRIEPFGWDSEDRTYIVLDDNRLYRLTEAPLPPPPKAAPKKRTKRGRASLRSSKRRKVSQAAVESEPEEDEDEPVEEVAARTEPEDDGFGGQKWECLAITLDEMNSIVASFEKTRDENERILRKRIVSDLLPLLEKQEESRKRKQAQKERELKNLEMLAHAKRSSRLASKMEHKREEEERRAAEKKHRAEVAMAKKEQEKWKKLEKARESRMQTREQRLKEREARRILHEEELANLSENGKKLEQGEAGRLSERHLKAAIEKKKQALEELENDDDWVFDCICGAYGQVDDGTLSIACERCNVWQHTKCVGVSDADAGRDDFQFVCSTCKRREKEAEDVKNRPKITLKVNRTSPQTNGHGASRPEYKPILPPSPVKKEQRHPQSSPARSPFDGFKDSRGALPPIAYTNGQNGDVIRPGSVGSTPVAPQWSSQANVQGQTPARPQFGAQLNRQSPFSSPLPHSPTSLPPPISQPNYNFANGNAAGSYNLQSSPAPAQNGYPRAYEMPRRTSVSFPSPLAGAPLNNSNGTVSTSAPSILPPLVNATPIRPPSNPNSAFTTPAQPVAETPYSTASNGSAMFQFSAGKSPVKQSPPLRPATANGSGSFGTSFGSGIMETPKQIPPIAPLSPSPRVVDPTPPVKQMQSPPIGGLAGLGNSFGGPFSVPPPAVVHGENGPGQSGTAPTPSGAANGQGN